HWIMAPPVGPTFPRTPPPLPVPRLFRRDQRVGPLAALCRQFGVRQLEVFGSAATGEYVPGRSDLDFLVEFSDGGPERALDAYFGLKEALETLFGRPVDLVIPGAVRNPYVRAEMERSRELVYAA
ncbi:MAG: nucleotidyltransferase family protein, partial [Gemmatimonadales bacterium]